MPGPDEPTADERAEWGAAQRAWDKRRGIFVRCECSLSGPCDRLCVSGCYVPTAERLAEMAASDPDLDDLLADACARRMRATDGDLHGFQLRIAAHLAEGDVYGIAGREGD